MNTWEKLIIAIKNIKQDTLSIEELELLREWYKNALCGNVLPLNQWFNFIK